MEGYLVEKPKQLTIEEIEQGAWYPVNKYLPPNLLPCTVYKLDEQKMFVSQPGAAYYSSKINCWYWFGKSQKFPDQSIENGFFTHWSPAI